MVVLHGHYINIRLNIATFATSYIYFKAQYNKDPDKRRGSMNKALERSFWIVSFSRLNELGRMFGTISLTAPVVVHVYGPAVGRFQHVVYVLGIKPPTACHTLKIPRVAHSAPPYMFSGRKHRHKPVNTYSVHRVRRIRTAWTFACHTVHTYAACPAL